MFTGIIEVLGTITKVEIDGTNRIFNIEAPLDEAVQVDQSIAHNGVCLTVTEVYQNYPKDPVTYSVTAVDETLTKTNLGLLNIGDPINIERSMKIGDRLDGHFVQGHVDNVGEVLSVEERDGSWIYQFRFTKEYAHLIVPKGSICVNGVSLTVVDCTVDEFSVTIIPYTYEHTNFHRLQPGDKVNLEYDILGKYLTRMKRLTDRQEVIG